MKPEQINRKIAEKCGWVHLNPAPEFREWPGYATWKRPDGVWFESPPDYFGDLNVVHEAESALPAVNRTGSEGYMHQLWAVVAHDGVRVMESTWYIAHATAPQRCEALLRTWGLWEDAP